MKYRIVKTFYGGFRVKNNGITLVSRERLLMVTHVIGVDVCKEYYIDDVLIHGDAQRFAYIDDGTGLFHRVAPFHQTIECINSLNNFKEFQNYLRLKYLKYIELCEADINAQQLRGT